MDPPPPADAPAAAEHLVLEPEIDDASLADSSFASANSATESMSDSIMQYRRENGRTYHAYKEGKYVLPNDESENDRLDLQHHLFALTFDGKLYTCPAGRDKQMHRILDAGTGTGIWALDMADAHPESAVVGVDLSPIQPAFVPPNLSYFIDDLEEPWTYKSKFDFIYARMLTGAIQNWPRFFEQCYENLQPGGWIELADIVFPIETDDDSIPPDSAIKKWTDLILEATDIFGSRIDSSKHYKDKLEAAGFQNVVVTMYKWPHTAWAKDKKYKEMGMWNRENICGSLSGLSMALFTRALNWTVEEMEVFLVQVREEYKNKSIHAWFPIYVVYAQKPE